MHLTEAAVLFMTDGAEEPHWLEFKTTFSAHWGKVDGVVAMAARARCPLNLSRLKILDGPRNFGPWSRDVMRATSKMTTPSTNFYITPTGGFRVTTD
ncbi:hypothetical protein TNCV_4068681 [Trichonephila clavipes]|nr:hypothetical protein TNCV_4068681 [Trichonephila clavipes]